MSKVSLGKQKADRGAKRQPLAPLDPALFPVPKEPIKSAYTPQDDQWALLQGGIKNFDGI